MSCDIRIGTASWTDPGFVEDWYPPKLPASQRLRWYAGHFNYVAGARARSGMVKSQRRWVTCV